MTGESGVMMMGTAHDAQPVIWGIMVELMQIIIPSRTRYPHIFDHLPDGRITLRMEPFLPYIFMAATAFVVTFVCTPAAKRLAIRLDAVDYPSKRRINTQPTPRLGGLAVFLGLFAAIAIAVYGSMHLGWPPVLVSHPSLAVDYRMLAVAVLLMVATGATDDIVQLSPKVKFAGQLIAASVAVAGGLVIHQIVNPFAGDAYIELGWLAYPITVIYLAAFTNIINLIDGLDGLASGISCIAALSMFSFAILAGRYDAAAFSLALAGSCVAQRLAHRSPHLIAHPANRCRRAHYRYVLRNHQTHARAREHRTGR